MDSPTPDLSVLRATMREKAEAATPGRWNWWTSCSWNRLSTELDGRLGRDGGVLCPVVNPYDRHPDLSVSEEDMAHIAASCPQNILAVLAHDDAEIARLTERAEAAERERDEVRGYLALLQDSKLHGRATAAEARVAELEALCFDCVAMMHEMGTHEADLDASTFALCHALLADVARLLPPEPNATPDGSDTGEARDDG